MTIHKSGIWNKIYFKLHTTNQFISIFSVYMARKMASCRLQWKRKKKLNEIDTEIDTSQQIYSSRLVFISLRCVPYSLLCVIPTSPILFYFIIQQQIVYRLLMTILMMTQLKYDTWSLIIMRRKNNSFYFEGKTQMLASLAAAISGFSAYSLFQFKRRQRN